MEERSEELWHEKARQLGIVVIIPTYNNEKTLTTVIEDVLFYVEDIIVSMTALPIAPLLFWKTIRTCISSPILPIKEKELP